jgi:type IV fimbrial biogenesis protein FimT
VLGPLTCGLRCRPRGLTLIEVMVVVAVAAVILTLTAPSLRDFMARQRVAAVNAELLTDLQFARSEAIARNRSVYVTFRTDHDALTCYTVHTRGTVGTCDCRSPVGTACPAISGLIEIKTVQVQRSTTVALAPPDLPANWLRFSTQRGMAEWRDHQETHADYVADWIDFPVGVESSRSGKLRTQVNISGRPQVCSPDSSIRGVAACAD